MESGLIDAYLGGLLYKKRVARPGGGKSGNWSCPQATQHHRRQGLAGHHLIRDYVRNPNKRNPDAGTPGSLTRENCSRSQSRAGRILKRINPADCDHLYQRVTQRARASPPFKQSWSTKAAARNYYGQNAGIRPWYAHFLLQRYDQHLLLTQISDHDLVVDLLRHLSDRAGFAARVRIAY
jgi:hypothetical protein